MGGGDSGGGSNTTTSTPLTGPQRAELYAYGMNSMGQSLPALGAMAQYNTPAYQGLANGDYDRLEQNIVTSRTAPLYAAYQTQSGQLDSDLAKRGIWSSGAAVQAQNDLTNSYLPQLTQAGAEAANQRYALQQQDLSSKNAFNMENANRQYNAQWTPFDKAMGVWNGTGGTVSTSSGSSGGGWNFMI